MKSLVAIRIWALLVLFAGLAACSSGKDELGGLTGTDIPGTETDVSDTDSASGTSPGDTVTLPDGTDGSDSADPDTDTHPVQSDVLTGVIRDFKDSHIDFENAGGPHETGIVAPDLGPDGKPVYAGGSGTATTHGAEAFDQWYRDVPGVNMATDFSIQFEEGQDGVFTYDNQSFFPIDDQLFGNQDREHNYHFTYEVHTVFTYQGGETFKFTGDDDLWVFINGRLAIDLGGVHGPLTAEADLDALADELQIEKGETYTLDFFFAERHVVLSTFRIDTTIKDLRPVVI